jgi:hypothetical protein
MEKIDIQNFKKYYRNNDGNATVARVGHLNSIIEEVNTKITAPENPQDGDALVYNSTTGLWEPGTPASALPYKVYTALLTQTETDDPVATVLENSLGGTLVWTRNSDGDYTATLIGAFPDENQFFTLNAISAVYSANTSVSVYWNDSDSFQLTTATGDGVTIPYTFVDDIIYNYPIEIRVYN